MTTPGLDPISTAVTVYSSLPLWAAALPMAGALAVHGAGRLRAGLRAVTAVFIALATTVLVASLGPLVAEGPVAYALPGLLGVGLVFRLDALGFSLALAGAVLWLLVTVYATWYMRAGRALSRFYPFCTFTLGSTLGVFMSGDLFTLFVFFELMTISFYVLAVHEQTPEALTAGSTYLYLGIAGGLSVLSGIFLLSGATGSTAFTPQLEALLGYGASPGLIAAFLVVGFGVKAGMVPLHIWIPQVYTKAPAPAAALCSAIMIKTGVYGMLRSLSTVLLPASAGGDTAAFYQGTGLTVLWFGLLSMVVGAVLAALQPHVFGILAYSSISQIGYILSGLGAALYLGWEGGPGVAGALYHSLNHGFFKAGLFLMVATVCLITGENRLDRLGGLLGRLPLTAAAVLVAGAALLGLPASSGYASKALIHEALAEAYHRHPVASMWLAERLFKVGSVLTVVYFARLFRGIFLGRLPGHLASRTYREPGPVRLVLGAICLAILAAGLFPGLIWTRLVAPAVAGQGFVLPGLGSLGLWQWKTASSAVTVLSWGLAIYLVAARYGWFSRRYPAMLSVEGMLVVPILKALAGLDRLVDRILNRGLEDGYGRLCCCLKEVMLRIGWADRAIDAGYARVGDGTRGGVGRVAEMEEAGMGAVERRLARLQESLTRAGENQPEDHREEPPVPSVSRMGQWVTSANWNVNVLVVAMMLMTLLLVLVFYGVTRW